MHPHMMHNSAQAHASDLLPKHVALMETHHSSSNKSCLPLRCVALLLWKRSLMHEGVYQKFLQNPRIASLLLNTYPRTLAEASPYDRIWGIGLHENDPRALDRNEWRGQNMLGEVLMNVRRQLRMSLSSVHGNMAKEVQIADAIVVKVDVGIYGKYVKLYRNEKWITISFVLSLFLQQRLQCFSNESPCFQVINQYLRLK